MGGRVYSQSRFPFYGEHYLVAERSALVINKLLHFKLNGIWG